MREQLITSALFENVASITKVLYERDSRLHFMSNGFWSSHNRQVVMNTVSLFSSLYFYFFDNRRYINLSLHP